MDYNKKILLVILMPKKDREYFKTYNWEWNIQEVMIMILGQWTLELQKILKEYKIQVS